MKTIFLLLLLVSVVYSIGIAYPKCGTIQVEKCAAFGTAAGAICFCKKKIDIPYADCKEYGETTCTDLPTGRLCQSSNSCKQGSQAEKACIDFCKQNGAVCNRSTKACGSFKPL